MPGYKHPCRYCNRLVAADCNVCPFCGKKSPVGPFRCPKCKSPVEDGFRACSHCGRSLTVACPGCGKETGFSAYCPDCGGVLPADLWLGVNEANKKQHKI